MKLFVSLFVVFLTACGGHSTGHIDKAIGETCISDRDCDDRCYVGGDFPGGFCSYSCLSDRDCPSDTYCMAAAGGVCMFVCPEFDCARLGPGWVCRDRSRIDGGSITVCSGD